MKLSAWHEASNLDGYPEFVKDRNMSAVHEYMQELCRGSNVRYGSIICAVPSETKAWMGTSLDWYGLDIYDFGEGQFRDWHGGISKEEAVRAAGGHARDVPGADRAGRAGDRHLRDQ